MPYKKYYPPAFGKGHRVDNKPKDKNIAAWVPPCSKTKKKS